MSSMLGTTLSGRYRLEERIGAGGMSTVYRAVDETLQRSVAIKLMHREVASDSDQLERFRREARAVARLSNPHVVGVIDAGEDDGRPYIVLEYVDGETLKDRIRNTGPLPIRESLACAIEIARALGSAHAHHIVHRDVKPQNVLIDTEGNVKVTDFGIARTLEEEGLTADGRVIGTSDYVAPEQALGRPVTGQSDLYSLGIVLYEMLTGEVPFKGDNQVAVAMKHVHEPLPDVRRRRPEVSDELLHVIATATAKEPVDRYHDERELIAGLELALEAERPAGRTAEMAALTDSPIPPAGPSGRGTSGRGTQRRLWPVLAALTGVAGVAAAIIAVVLLATHRSTTTTTTTRTVTGATRRVSPVNLCASCAVAYNPDGFGGDVTQNNAQATAVTDGNTSSLWHTETYYAGNLGKPGVGIYVNAGQPILATRMTIVTPTPGFAAEIYGSTRTPDPSSFSASGWHRLATVTSVSANQRISLRTTAGKSTYYLVWITKLPTGERSAAIGEIRLYH